MVTEKPTREEIMKVFRSALQKHFGYPQRGTWLVWRIRWKATIWGFLHGRLAARQCLRDDWTREVLAHTRWAKQMAKIMAAPLRRMRDYTAIGRRIFQIEDIPANPIIPPPENQD